MYLEVTVALGKITKPYRRSRLERLLEAIETLSDDVDLEPPYIDTESRWRYTFKIEVESIAILRKTLHNSGRFKILIIRDVYHHSILYQKKGIIM